MSDLFAGLPRNHFGAILADPPWAFEAWYSGGWRNRPDGTRYYSSPMACDTKFCPRCQRALRLIVGKNGTFARNSFRDDRVQILCRECDERRKSQEPDYGWQEFKRRYPTMAAHWTKKEYLDLVAVPPRFKKYGSCSYCGNSLAIWGKGHKIDRIDSKRLHTPDNCVACCSGCNWAKGSMNPNAWHLYLQDILRRYDRGKVPWQTIHEKGPKPSFIPDLSEFEIKQQMTFSDYDGIDDAWKSVEVARSAIRERMANGGPGWEPK